MKIFLNLFLVAVLFLIPVSIRADDTAMPSVEIPEEEMQILKDNATALKNTVSETKAYLENGLSKWTWVKDTFGNHKYPEILELINTVDKHGFSKHMGNAIGTLSGYENGIKKTTDTHADLKAMGTFYNRYKPDKNNPLRSLEQVSHVLEDLNSAIEKFDPSGGVLTRPIREMIQYFQESADAFHGALGRIRKIIKERGGGGIGLGFTADTHKGKAFKKQFPNQTAYRYQWLKLKQAGSNTDEAEIWDDGSGNAFVWWKNKWIKIKPGIAGITFVYKGHHLAFGKIPQINYLISRCNTGWDKVLQARIDGKNYFKIIYSDSECASKILAHKKITLEKKTEETFIARYVFRRDIRKKIDDAIHLIKNSLLVEGKVVQAQTSDKSIANVPIIARLSGSTARTTSKSGGWFTLLINTKPSFENRRNAQVTINMSGYEPYNKDWPIRQQCSTWYSINLQPISPPDSENSQNNPPGIEVETLCRDAEKAAAALVDTMQAVEKEIVSLEGRLRRFSSNSEELIKKSKSINTRHKETEKKAAKVAELAHELEKIALKICEATNGLNDHTIADSEHQRNYDWINRNKGNFKEPLNLANSLLRSATDLQEGNKQLVDDINRLKDTLQAAFLKLEKDLQSLQRNNNEGNNRLNKLMQKVARIPVSECSQNLVDMLGRARIGAQINREKLDQTADVYEGVKINFDKAAYNIGNIDQMAQKSAYLIDLSTTYVERASNAAGKGAFCAVLADGIMERVFIPDVRGIEISTAKLMVRRKGLAVNTTQIGPPPLEGDAGRVKDQTPDTTKRAKKGTLVTLSYYEETPDRDSLLANKDCSQWPGSQAVWDISSDKPACDCPGDMAWNQDNTKCISKIDAALEKANCPYPNSYPVWNAANKRAECACLPGTEWNKDKSACLDSKQAALENIDCSRYPGTIPGYDNNGNLMCLCPDGLPWVKDWNRCANQKDVAMASLDCSKYPGAVSEWDFNNNKPVCNCPEGTRWDNAQQRCVNKGTPIPEPRNGNQCPGQNPGNSNRNRFDTNSNPNDNTYIECNYWQDGALQYQMPYRNGKKDGVSLSTKSDAHHQLAQKVEYKNGKLNGYKTVWSINNSGQHYKLWEEHYTNGKKNSFSQWYSNGKLSHKNTYRNGRLVERCSYPRNGGPGRCKKE